ncbi:PAS domain S-box protein [Aeoliella sp. SH292]|uniref:PAS domain S-box protein n=1 Tax=Aeoliella sp. SH292 TaxID=3454464 RepID=UPI003F98B5D0
MVRLGSTNPKHRVLYLIVAIAGTFSVVGGAVTLLGWFANAPRWTDWWGDGISMFPNAALCGILCGIAVLLLVHHRWHWQMVTIRTLAAIVALIGGLTFLEHLSGINFGIDSLLIERDWGQKATYVPMRMGMPASMSFVLLGVAVLMATGSPSMRRNACALAIVPVIIASLSLIGYLFDADQLYGVAKFTAIARQTSTIIAALGIAVVASIPEFGFAAAMTRADTSGSVLRRLILPVLLIPLLLSWIHVLAKDDELIDDEFGNALRTLVEAGLLIALLWWTARRLAQHASAAHDARLRLAAIVESSADAVVSKSLDGIVQSWNEGATRIFGYRPEEIIGKNISILIPADRLNEETEILSKIRQGDRVQHYETIRVRKDGRHIHVSLTVSPLRGATGEVIGASKIARDITESKHAQEALRRSEAELHTLANSIPQLAWMADPDGSVIWYNQTWYDYTGTDFQQMEGWGWKEVHDPAVLPAVIERWNDSVKTGANFEMEFPIRSRAGAFRWFLTRARPLHDESGKVIRWFGTSTDIDEAKATEKALLEKTNALELLNETNKTVGSKLDLPDLLQAVTDVATELTDAKIGAFFYKTKDEQGEPLMLCTFAGPAREQFEQHGMPSDMPLFGPTFAGDGIIRSDDICIDPRYRQLELQHSKSPDEFQVHSYLAAPVRSRMGEVIGGLLFGHSEPGVFTEATERLVAGLASQAGVAIDNSRLYENLKTAAEEREHLLQAERSARSEAERLNLLKDEFLATLSHELRTPLNAILGWSQLLGRGDASEEDLHEGLETIERNARAQTQLIEDLLDMSRIVSGRIRLDVQPTDLGSVLELAIDSVRPSADAKQITLRKVLDPRVGQVAGDPTRLQQVFWNLLSNAIKFTPRDGTIDVVLERVNSHAEITFRDTGIGIPPEFLANVFDRFRQADSSTTRRYGGLGLGLSIVKNLVELHGGHIEVFSEGQDKGSTFTISLPLMPVRERADRRHPTSMSDAPTEWGEVVLSGTKILVLDDEADARQLLTRVLTHYEATVESAANAEAAIELVKRWGPDVIVSDIGMPGTDGYEFIRRVRALSPNQGARTPAIALTAFARSEDRTQAMLAGYQLHVAKPIQPQELAASIASLLHRVDPVSS